MKKPVRLGLMPPLSGVVGIYGTEIIRAAEVARDEINERGGILDRPLELVVEDDGSMPQSAVNAAEKLVSQHRCTAIIGNLLSNSRIAVAYRVAEPNKVPYLNFSFYEGGIISRYFFHFAALPNQQIDRMIPLMKSRFGSRMFFAGNSYEWPRGSIDAAKRILRSQGGEVLGEEYLPFGASPEALEALLDTVAQSNADVFVPYFAGLDQVELLTRFSNRGLKTRMAVVMGHFDENMASHLPPQVREGYYSCNTYFMSVPTPENQALLDRLARHPGVKGIWPQGDGIITNFSEATYLSVKAFALAANQAGSLDAEALVDALEQIQFKGPQGDVVMDPRTHHAKVNTFLTRCTTEGTFEIVENLGLNAPVIPERYRHMGTSARDIRDESLRIAGRIMDYMTEGVNLVDVESCNIIYANPGSAHMFKCQQQDMVGRDMTSLYAPSDLGPKEISQGINRELYRHGIWEGDIKYINSEHEPFWCSVSISAFTHAEFGEVWLVVQKDITRQKQAEAKLESLNQQLEQRVEERTRELKALQETLVRSERLATLGQLTATVSHELRNPLSVIYSSVESVNRLLVEKGISANRAVQRILRSVTRCTTIIEDMLEYTRVMTPHPQSLNLDAWVSELLEEFNLPAGVTLVNQLNANGAKVLIDPERMRRALINLIDNAVQSMGGNTGASESQGTLCISSFAQDEAVTLSIQDSGAGLSPEAIKHLFDPLFSTKPFGVGLGLPIVRNIIESHKGVIRLQNRTEGNGVVATLVLPRESLPAGE